MAKRLKYAAENMEKALEAVRSGRFSQRAASKEFSVPRATLQDKLTGRVPEGRRMGPETILSKEEDVLEAWIIEVCKLGFPRKKEDLLNTVQKMMKAENRPNPFKDDRPGETWYRRYMDRHPAIRVRTPESVNKGRASTTEQGIRKWFEDLENYLTNEDHADILEDGSRILNADETNFQLCPKSGKILGIKGWKNVYEISAGNEKETLTVLCTFRASGDVAKGMIVYPYQRPPKDIVESVPDSWGIGLSESGWMKSDTFYEYVGNILYPWLEENHVKFPVLFFVDGHKSHFSYKLSQLCHEKQIILYCLPPNATHILQPADVSVFRPLKSQWKKEMTVWKNANPSKTFARKDFAGLVDRALAKISSDIISNGFRACGIFPFDADAVDYSKCVPPFKNKPETDEQMDEQPNVHQEYAVALRVVEEIAKTGVSTVDEILHQLKSKVAADETQSIASMSHAEDFQPPDMDQPTAIDIHLLKVASTSGELEKQANTHISSLTASDNHHDPAMPVIDINFQPDISEEHETREEDGHNMSFNVSDFLDTSIASNPFEDIEAGDQTCNDVDILLQSVTQDINDPEQTTEPQSRTSNDVDMLLRRVTENVSDRDQNIDPHDMDMQQQEVSTSLEQPIQISETKRAFSGHLFWPVDNNINKENRKPVRSKLPSAVSSSEWRKLYSEKEEKNKQLEEEKQKRKEERMRKKEEKESIIKAAKSVDRKRKNPPSKSAKRAPKTKKQKEEDAPCLYCSSPFSESRPGEHWVQCQKCKRWAHERCADTRSDSFVCELCG